MFKEFIKRIKKTVKYRKNDPSIREQELLKIFDEQKSKYSSEIANCKNDVNCVNCISKKNQIFIDKTIKILKKSQAMTDSIHLYLVL